MDLANHPANCVDDAAVKATLDAFFRERRSSSRSETADDDQKGSARPNSSHHNMAQRQEPPRMPEEHDNEQLQRQDRNDWPIRSDDNGCVHGWESCLGNLPGKARKGGSTQKNEYHDVEDDERRQVLADTAARFVTKLVSEVVTRLRRRSRASAGRAVAVADNRGEYAKEASAVIAAVSGPGKKQEAEQPNDAAESSKLKKPKGKRRRSSTKTADMNDSTEKAKEELTGRRRSSKPSLPPEAYGRTADGSPITQPSRTPSDTSHQPHRQRSSAEGSHRGPRRESAADFLKSLSTGLRQAAQQMSDENEESELEEKQHRPMLGQRSGRSPRRPQETVPEPASRESAATNMLHIDMGHALAAQTSMSPPNPLGGSLDSPTTRRCSPASSTPRTRSPAAPTQSMASYPPRSPPSGSANTSPSPPLLSQPTQHIDAQEARPSPRPRQRETLESVKDLPSEYELKDAIALTKALLRIVIHRPKLTTKLLRRPPFAFLHAVISEIVWKTGFASSLFSPDELWRPLPSDGQHHSNQVPSCYPVSKPDRIRFLVRTVACVAFTAPLYMDLLTSVSPAKLLAGLEPIITNQFLQALAVACRAGKDAVRKAEQKTLETGVEKLYQDAIKRRGSVTRIQAGIRGHLTRKRLREDASYVSPARSARPVRADDTTTPARYMGDDDVGSEKVYKSPKRGRAKKRQRSSYEDELKQWDVGPPSQAHSPVHSPKVPEALLAAALEPKEARHAGPLKPLGRVQLREELKEMRKRVVEADKYLATKHKHDEVLEKAVRARRKAEKQLETLVTEKDSIEMELRRAVEGHRKLAETLKRAVDTRRRMEEDLKRSKAEQSQEQGVLRPAAQQEESPAGGAPHVDDSTTTLDLRVDHEMQELERKRKEVEKREAEVRVLAQKLKQKQGDTDQLNEWEVRLKRREERIEKLAEKLRWQRDKLKVTQQQARGYMTDYETRVKALQRLSMALIKQQQQQQQAKRLHVDRNEEQLAPIEDGIGMEAPPVAAQELMTSEDEQSANALVVASSDVWEDSAESEHAEFNTIFNEMLEHAEGVVDILPQLPRDISSTESMSVPAERRKTSDSDIIPAKERVDIEAKLRGLSMREALQQQLQVEHMLLDAGEAEPLLLDATDDAEALAVAVDGPLSDHPSEFSSFLGGSYKPNQGFSEKPPVWDSDDNFKKEVGTFLASKDGRPQLPFPGPSKLPYPSGPDGSSADSIKHKPSKNKHHASASHPPAHESLEQREYRICLARIETYLRRRRITLADLMPDRPNCTIPDVLSLRDFRLILQALNKDIFTVLTRRQVDLMLKLAPRVDGNCVDQKLLESMMRKAFMTLGSQKFLDSGATAGADLRAQPVGSTIAAPAAGEPSEPAGAAAGTRAPNHQKKPVKKKSNVQQSSSQISWLTSFDDRFDNAVKRLEVIRDQTHISEM